MLMPKTPMHENRFFKARENDIRFARETSPMEAITIT
jgi:hypothetical protein